MVRARCCEKKELRKGQWKEEEDQILKSYIQKYGHGNWRALPKKAGLQRCGKSCRLRWVNYLRPGVKRGNFTREEEDTIMALHQQLGNRWSTIAAQLPGRTDNEIKNVWNTHLKKRLRLKATNQGLDCEHQSEHASMVEPSYASSEATSIDTPPSCHNHYSTSKTCDPKDGLADYSWEQLCEIDDSNTPSSQPMELLDTGFDWNHDHIYSGHDLVLESDLVPSQRSIDIAGSNDATSETCDSINRLPEYSWEQLQELDDSINAFASQPMEPFVMSCDWNQECSFSITLKEEEGDIYFWKRMLTQVEQSLEL